MTKLSVLKRKIIRAYKNPKNWEHSRFKGYPEGTYYGYESLEDVIKGTVKEFITFYGRGLKKWRYN